MMSIEVGESICSQISKYSEGKVKIMPNIDYAFTDMGVGTSEPVEAV